MRLPSQFSANREVKGAEHYSGYNCHYAALLEDLGNRIFFVKKCIKSFYHSGKRKREQKRKRNNEHLL